MEISTHTSSCNQSSPPETSEHTSTFSGCTDLALFLERELKEEFHKRLATWFGGVIQGDTSKRNIDFDKHLHLLGYKSKQEAVDLLQKTFPDIRPCDNECEGNNKRTQKNASYVISFDEYEKLLSAAQTVEGNMAGRAVLVIKNIVFKFIKIEQNREKQQLEEQISKSAVEERKRHELENELQTERANKAKLAARKADEDVPLEKVYIMSSQGLVKIGLTTGEIYKRHKQMETGNPDISVTFCIDCIDARLIERNMHFMLRWYKRKGEWYDIDAQTASRLLRLTNTLLDGVRRLELDEVEISTAIAGLFTKMGVSLPDPKCTVKPRVVPVVVCDRSSDKIDVHPFEEYVKNSVEPCSRECWVQWMALLADFRTWHDTRFPHRPLSMGQKAKDIRAVRDYFVRRLGPIMITQRKGKDVNGIFGWRLRKTSSESAFMASN